jgi:hypothetical protein
MNALHSYAIIDLWWMCYMSTLLICRVGHNHIYTVNIRCFWLGNHHIYGVYKRFWPTLLICDECAAQRSMNLQWVALNRRVLACTVLWSAFFGRSFVINATQIIIEGNSHLCRATSVVPLYTFRTGRNAGSGNRLDWLLHETCLHLQNCSTPWNPSLWHRKCHTKRKGPLLSIVAIQQARERAMTCNAVQLRTHLAMDNS